jgi:hypothetical protein
MMMLASGGAVTVRFGAHVQHADAERIRELAAAMGPVSAITLDFGKVREIDAGAMVSLARALREVRGARVRVRHAPARHLAVLELLGVAPDPAPFPLRPR